MIKIYQMPVEHVINLFKEYIENSSPENKKEFIKKMKEYIEEMIQ